MEEFWNKTNVLLIHSIQFNSILFYSLMLCFYFFPTSLHITSIDLALLDCESKSLMAGVNMSIYELSERERERTKKRMMKKLSESNPFPFRTQSTSPFGLLEANGRCCGPLCPALQYSGPEPAWLQCCYLLGLLHIGTQTFPSQVRVSPGALAMSDT